MVEAKPDRDAGETNQQGQHPEVAENAPQESPDWWENYRRKYAQEVDNMFYRTEKYAEEAFRTNRYINIIVVSLGVLMILYAILQSAYKGADLSTVSFGGLGILDFFGLAFWTSQAKIEKSIGVLTQVQIIYRAWTHEVDALLESFRERTERGKVDSGFYETYNNELEKRTKFSIEEIHKLIGK